MANNQKFSLCKLTDIILVIGECQERIKPAKRLYHTKYAEKRQPSRDVSRKALRRFTTTGSVGYVNRKKREFIVSEAIETSTLLSVIDVPIKSTRVIGSELEYSP